MTPEDSSNQTHALDEILESTGLCSAFNTGETRGWELIDRDTASGLNIEVFYRDEDVHKETYLVAVLSKSGATGDRFNMLMGESDILGAYARHIYYHRSLTEIDAELEKVMVSVYRDA